MFLDAEVPSEHLPWAKTIRLQPLFRTRRFPDVLSIRGICFRSRVNPKQVKSIGF
jgi:hypothetical protein